MNDKLTRSYSIITLRLGETFKCHVDFDWSNDLQDFEIDTQDVEFVLRDAFVKYLTDVRRKHL